MLIYPFFSTILLPNYEKKTVFETVFIRFKNARFYFSFFL